MNPDSISMKSLFPECVAELEEVCSPVPYTELTRRALRRLGADPTAERVRLNAEDVREKLLQEGRRGTIYICSNSLKKIDGTRRRVAKPGEIRVESEGRDFRYAAMRDWFCKAGEQFINPESSMASKRRIPGDAMRGIEGAFVLAMRKDWLQTKNPSADPRARWTGAARGYVIESHIRAFFQESWPLFYMPPDNEGKWDRWCDHDFKLRLPSGVVLPVDAMGPDQHEWYGGDHKRPTAIHICAKVDGPDVVIDGWMPGCEIKIPFPADQTEPMYRLFAWLNCAKEGVDYCAVRNAIYGQSIGPQATAAVAR